MMYVIYIFKNKQNGKVYVGVTDNFKHRISSHKSKAKHGSKLYFHRALAKYGIDMFDYYVIDKFNLQCDALIAEKDWIKFFSSNLKDFGYNLTEGGEGTSGHTWTPSLENRLHMSQAHLGVSLSERHKSSISESLIGINNPNYGKEPSPKTKKRISSSLKNSGKRKTKLTQKIADLIREEYKTIKSSYKLSEQFGVSPSTIQQIIRGILWVNDTEESVIIGSKASTESP